MTPTPVSKFLKKTVINVSRATILGVAVLFFVFAIPTTANAQTLEVPTSCYTLGTSTISFDQQNWLSCLDAKIDTVPPTVYFANYNFTSPPTFLADMTLGKHETGSLNLLCNAPSECTTGFGTNPAEGTARQFRYSTGYLSGTFATLTLKYENGEFVPYYDMAPVNTIQQPTQIGTTGFSATTNTRFTSLAITGTTDLTLEAGYFLDLDEIDTNRSSQNPKQVAFTYSLRPTTDSTSFSESIDSTIAGTSTASYVLTSLADGVYDVKVSFTNLSCLFDSSDCPFPYSYAYSDFTIASGTLTAVGNVEVYDAQSFLDDGYANAPCSVTQLGGCITNSLAYLFYPSTDSVDLLTAQYEYLQTKIPFVYAYQAGDMISSMYTGTASVVPELTVTTGLGDITFISQEMIETSPLASMVPVVRTLIAYGLWLMLFVAMYRKTITVHDNVTAA